MKLVPHPSGYIYAHPRGGTPISLKTKDMKEAIRTAKELKLDELEQAKKLGILSASVVQSLRGAQKVTVEGAVAQYIEAMRVDGNAPTTIDRTGITLRHWIRSEKVGGLLIGAIERRHIDPWVNPTNDIKYSSRSRNLAAVNQFFKYCSHQNWLLENPAQQVTVRRDKLSQAQLVNKVTEPFTDDEVRRIVAALEPGTFWHWATLVAYHTGLRMGDIGKLEWSNIRGDSIVVCTSKTRIEVAHKMHPDVKAALSKIDRNESRYLFPAVASLCQGKGQSTLSHQFTRLCMKLGIEDKHFHGMRHTFALKTKQEEKRKIFQEMLEQLSTHNTMVAMGHTSPATTRIYLSHGNK